MKRSGILISLFLLLSVTGFILNPLKHPGENPGKTVLKKYPVKSGVIRFERTGISDKVKIMVYFDNYGITERNETYNSEGNVEEIKIADGEKMYVINFKYSEDKIAYITGPGKFGTEMKFVAEPFTSEEDIAKYQFKKLPNMNVAGKNCEAYSTATATGEVIFAGWSNICLYSETKSKYGDSKTVAVEINENVPVDPGFFKIPEGFEIKVY